MGLNYEKILVGYDNLLGVNYDIVKINAKHLSSYLKTDFENNGINYQDFNTSANLYSFEKDFIAKTISNPPLEIYEYQNFFLLLTDSNKYVLLDGFRRLLWYNAPDIDIFVRIYKQSILSNEQILSLLVNLNHFKFFSGGDNAFHDRGFALFLKTIFGIDITKFRMAFVGYLTSNEIKSSYSSGIESNNYKQNKNTKDRITSKGFVDNIKFLQILNNSGCMVNQYFGVILYQHSIKNPDIIFDADKFIEIQNSNNVLADLLLRYRKIGTTNGSESQKVVNKILEMYENILITLEGGEATKSYAEIVDECKQISAGIQKNKEWTKLTGATTDYRIERVMEKKIRDGEVLKFKCVVYPNPSDYKKEEQLSPGLNDNVEFDKFFTRSHWGATPEMDFILKDKNNIWKVHHNFTGNFTHGYNKKYVRLEMYKGINMKHDIDLFVNIPKSEIPKK